MLVERLHVGSHQPDVARGSYQTAHGKTSSIDFLLSVNSLVFFRYLLLTGHIANISLLYKL